MPNDSTARHNQYIYTIGSGWWCTEDDDEKTNPLRQTYGDDVVRSLSFFDLWLDSIKRTTKPHSIAVVDSRSPVKPDQQLQAQVAWLELPFNARHSTNHLGKWAGWTRSVLLGGQYALLSDTEYFVYVEQDCLLFGTGIIEHCIDKMDRDFMFGSGEGTPQPLQQSFFIIKKQRLAQFLANLSALKQDDKDLSPEWKFVYATWRPFVIAANLGLLKRHRVKHWVLHLARKYFFQELPVRGGRARPLPQDDAFYYFQHGTAQELQGYYDRIAQTK